MDVFAIAIGNLLSPMVLCFGLGLAGAAFRSELSIPEAAARMMSIYLLFAIGFKGGAEVARHGLGTEVLLAMALGVVLSFVMPLLAFALLRLTTRLSTIDAAATAAHYGSISIVTFVAGTQALESAGIAYDGYMVAVAAAMEAPAIISALWLVTRGRDGGGSGAPKIPLEVLVNGSVVLLIGAFLIGWASGEKGFATVAPFIDEPFKGVLCLFLLDMGLLAGRFLRESAGQLSPGVVAAGIYMPVIGALCSAPLAALLGLSGGSLALMITLAASASYIAVPAALRIALPEANPAIYLTLSLGLTFPFNLTVGIPSYIALAQALS